jgi:uncharacterized protein (DUF2147 family)
VLEIQDLKRLLVSLAALACLAAAPASAAGATTDVFGVWRNPKNSVHVDIRPCGDSACGYVVWASEKARKAAFEGSGKELVGQQLFREFVKISDEWRGRVFVPDLNRTFSGGARLRDDTHLEARGCVLGRILCKTQLWTRIS